MPVFRFANAADVAPIVALIEHAYRSPHNAGDWDSESHLLTGPRTSAKEIAGFIADPDSAFVVAVEETSIIGCALIQRRPVPANAPRSERGAYFGMFAIDPGIRAAGLGKQVLAEAERRARDRFAASHLVLTVISLREPLMQWYERRGYRRTGNRHPFPFTETSGETRRDFDLVEMRKELPES